MILYYRYWIYYLWVDRERFTICDRIRQMCWGTSCMIIIKVKCLLLWLRVSTIHWKGFCVSFIISTLKLTPSDQSPDSLCTRLDPNLFNTLNHSDTLSITSTRLYCSVSWTTPHSDLLTRSRLDVLEPPVRVLQLKIEFSLFSGTLHIWFSDPYCTNLM